MYSLKLLLMCNCLKKNLDPFQRYGQFVILDHFQHAHGVLQSWNCHPPKISFPHVSLSLPWCHSKFLLLHSFLFFFCIYDVPPKAPYKISQHISFQLMNMLSLHWPCFRIFFSLILLEHMCCMCCYWWQSVTKVVETHYSFMQKSKKKSPWLNPDWMLSQAW